MAMIMTNRIRMPKFGSSLMMLGLEKLISVAIASACNARAGPISAMTRQPMSTTVPTAADVVSDAMTTTVAATVGQVARSKRLDRVDGGERQGPPQQFAPQQ